jgi:hypothetical protein
MPQGKVTISKPCWIVMNRVHLDLAAANATVLKSDDTHLRFRHGRFFNARKLWPKKGLLEFKETETGTEVSYDVNLTGGFKACMTFAALLTLWLIFPPLMILNAMDQSPREFIENLLAGIKK